MPDMISASLILASLPLFANAVNDWSKPCFHGSCSYDVSGTPNTMPGSMAIFGSPNAISDITEAAGWKILGCDANADAQDIRLVCMSSDSSAAGCDHLYQNGAEHTIVRLPESCLKAPFAHVSRAWVPEDQSIPSSVARRIIKRADGSSPQVKALALDTNFAAATNQQDSNVTLAIQGSSIPGDLGNATITNATAVSRRSRPLERRGVVSDFITQALDKFKSLDNLSTNVSTSLPPIDLNQNFPIFGSALTACGGALSAGVNVSAHAKAHADVSLGVVASGTLVPPVISQFATYAGVTANLVGSLNFVASASGTLDSGTITLFETGLPGLSFPGVLTVGPAFKLNADAKASLDISLNLGIDINYDIDKLQLFFPPIDGQVTNGALTPGDSPLTLALTPAIASKATLEGHIIPTIEVGLNAFSNTAAANLFLNMDANAHMTLTLDASADGVVNGCVDLGGGVSANAGADASFFSLFDKSTSVAIFEKDFDLFKQCLGDAATKRRFAKRSSLVAPSGTLAKRTLACPAASASAPTSVFSQVLPATSFVPVTSGGATQGTPAPTQAPSTTSGGGNASNGGAQASASNGSASESIAVASASITDAGTNATPTVAPGSRNTPSVGSSESNAVASDSVANGSQAKITGGTNATPTAVAEPVNTLPKSTIATPTSD